MSTETEVKVTIESPGSFCGQLEALHPFVVSKRHFEDNFLLDFPGGILKSSRQLFRVRFAAEKAWLTYKGAPKENDVFKTREEIETGLENGARGLQIFERLGMRVWFRYQKYRREYRVEQVTVAVDETPIGNYVELEGSESGIYDLARMLDIDTSRFLRHSYYSLYLESCTALGISPGNMMF